MGLLVSMVTTMPQPLIHQLVILNLNQYTEIERLKNQVQFQRRYGLPKFRREHRPDEQCRTALLWGARAGSFALHGYPAIKFVN